MQTLPHLSAAPPLSGEEGRAFQRLPSGIQVLKQAPGPAVCTGPRSRTMAVPGLVGRQSSVPHGRCRGPSGTSGGWPGLRSLDKCQGPATSAWGRRPDHAGPLRKTTPETALRWGPWLVGYASHNRVHPLHAPAWGGFSAFALSVGSACAYSFQKRLPETWLLRCPLEALGGGHCFVFRPQCIWRDGGTSLIAMN